MKISDEVRDLLTDVRQSLESYLAVQVAIDSNFQEETHELLVRIQHMMGPAFGVPDEYAELVTAHADGFTIQCKSVHSGLWRDVPDPGWNSPVESYRVKPGTGYFPEGGFILNDDDRERLGLKK